MKLFYCCRRCLLVWSWMAAGLLACAHNSVTVTLSPAADTSLFESSPDNNLGGDVTLVSGSTSRLVKSRALLRFDIAAKLPTNAIVTAVSLTINVVNVPGGGTAGPTTFSLHRLLQPWGEGNKTGNSGAAASAGEPTWNARISPDTNWSRPGAAPPQDFAEASSATTSVAGLGSYNFDSTNLVTEVQNWADHPETNFGWILVNEHEDVAQSARRFGARESATPPSLVVQYSEPPPDFRIEEVQITKDYLLLHLDLLADHAYSVQFRESFSDVGWQALTNFPARPFFQHIVFPDPRADHAQRFYRIELQLAPETPE